MLEQYTYHQLLMQHIVWLRIYQTWLGILVLLNNFGLAGHDEVPVFITMANKVVIPALLADGFDNLLADALHAVD